MNRTRSALVIAGLLAGSLPVLLAAEADAPCIDLAPAPMVFDEPVWIDSARAGGEPVVATGLDGSLNVSAHAGTTHVYKDAAAVAGIDDFLVGYTNQTLNWRSTDGGQTWDHVGLHGANTGPHTATSTGFSDPDYAVDQAGNIYNTEINLVNVAVYASLDDGQSYPIGNPYVTAGDRPWLVALEEGEVFLYVTTASQLLRSTDHGLTWIPVATGVPITAKPYPDPRNPDDGIIGPAGTEAIAISGDDGATWTIHDGAYLGAGVAFFDNDLAIDDAGNAYRARARGYNGPGDTKPTGEVVFNAFNRDTETWGDPVVIDLPWEGDAMWPWLTAGDEGKVALSWMMNSADDPNAFHIVTAHTLNALGTDVTCPDGSSERLDPAFTVQVVTPDPIHVGDICLNGTGCNTSLGEAGDRRLGEFFSSTLDLDGNLWFATASTMLRTAAGGPKPVSNPLFVMQKAGPRLRSEPIEPRPTRCLTGTQETGLCQR